jgi:hypothetical protein
MDSPSSSFLLIITSTKTIVSVSDYGPVHPAYNPSFLAYFFSRNSIFLSQEISQQCFSAGLSAQPNGAYIGSVSGSTTWCHSTTQVQVLLNLNLDSYYFLLIEKLHSTN